MRGCKKESAPIQPAKASERRNREAAMIKLNSPTRAREAYCHGVAEFPRVIRVRGWSHGIAFLPPYEGASSYYPLCG